jgi:DNA-binding MarR family transcriptional regulator
VSKAAFLAQTTSLPNWLLDEALPHLTESEMKLLFLIARHTRGWVDSQGKRKTADWMTGKLIQAKTGCSSASVSRAIASLLKKGLVEVRDSEGALLLTSSERQRSKQLYFSLRDSLKEPSGTVTPRGMPESLKKSNVTNVEESQLPQIDELHPARIAEPHKTDEPFTTDTSPKSDKSLTKSHSNVKTTKENKKTKENLDNSLVVPQNEKLPNDELPTMHQNEELPQRTAIQDGISQGDEFQGDVSQGRRSDVAKKLDVGSLSSEARQVLYSYREQFKQQFPEKSLPTTSLSDLQLLESYLEKRTSQSLINLLPRFFLLDYGFNSQYEYSFHTFVHSVNVLLFGMQRLARMAQPDVTQTSAMTQEQAT